MGCQQPPVRGVHAPSSPRDVNPPPGAVEGVKTQPPASPEPRLQLSPLRRGGFVTHATAKHSWVPAPQGHRASPLGLSAHPCAR